MTARIPLYAETLAALRESTGCHESALSSLACSCSGIAETGSFEHLETIATRAQAIEDAAIGAVLRLSRRTDRATALRAIEESGAGWLLDVILNRAAETTLPGAALSSAASARRRG